MQKMATLTRACLSALRCGNFNRSTAYGESYIKWFLDTGSIPVISTRRTPPISAVFFFRLVEMTRNRTTPALLAKTPSLRQAKQPHIVRTKQARGSGSYLPLGDRQACLPGEERANIRSAKFPSFALAPRSSFHLCIAPPISAVFFFRLVEMTRSRARSRYELKLSISSKPSNRTLFAPNEEKG